jgi:hypothetical protein
MKKFFILVTTLSLMFGQETKAQEIKMDTTNNVVDLRLEKLLNNSCNGIISGIFGTMIAGIGYATYKDAIGVDKNSSDYTFYKTYYDNKVKLSKGMMIGGGLLALVGGGVTITAQKKIKINLLIKEISLSYKK